VQRQAQPVLSEQATERGRASIEDYFSSYDRENVTLERPMRRMPSELQQQIHAGWRSMRNIGAHTEHPAPIPEAVPTEAPQAQSNRPTPVTAGTVRIAFQTLCELLELNVSLATPAGGGQPSCAPA
jgi:hypothetical protein